MQLALELVRRLFIFLHALCASSVTRWLCNSNRLPAHECTCQLTAVTSRTPQVRCQRQPNLGQTFGHISCQRQPWTHRHINALAADKSWLVDRSLYNKLQKTTSWLSMCTRRLGVRQKRATAVNSDCRQTLHSCVCVHRYQTHSHCAPQQQHQSPHVSARRAAESTTLAAASAAANSNAAFSIVCHTLLLSPPLPLLLLLLTLFFT